MKKIQLILGIYCILLFVMTGCRDSSIEQGKEILQGQDIVSKEEPLYNTAFEKYTKDEGVALIINEPEEEIVEGLTKLETYIHHENSEKLLIIPKYNGSEIEVKKVAFDGEKLVENESLYANTSTEDGYGLLIETFRPEGIPELLIRVTIGDKEVSYVIAEDGKEGVPTLIYLNVNE